MHQHNVIKCKKKSWLIHVPAAAVIHEWRALFVLIECTGCVDVYKNNKILKFKKGFLLTFINWIV